MRKHLVNDHRRELAHVARARRRRARKTIDRIGAVRKAPFRYAAGLGTERQRIDYTAGCGIQAQSFAARCQLEIHVVRAVLRIAIRDESGKTLLAHTDKRQLRNAILRVIGQVVGEMQPTKVDRLRFWIVKLEEIVVVTGRIRHPLVNPQVRRQPERGRNIN